MKEFYHKYLRPSVKHNPGFREVLVFLTFLVFYKISRFIAIGDAELAFANAYKIVEFEKLIGIFYEIPIQQFFLDKQFFIKILNEFYMRIHLPSSIIFFVWLYHRRRQYYFYIRNGFLFANVITIFFFIGYPCAPPRMLNELGFVDTLLEVSKINLYQGVLAKLFNQYAAVPSMHFGNSLLIALVTFLLHKTTWVRWSILIYPLFVLFVIVVTGNHFFMDAVLGGIVVLFPYPVMNLIERIFPTWTKVMRGPVLKAFRS